MQEKRKETWGRRRRRNQRALWEETRHNVLRSVIINKCFPISAKTTRARNQVCIILEFGLASLVSPALSPLLKGQTDSRVKPCYAAVEGKSPAGSYVVRDTQATDSGFSLRKIQIPPLTASLALCSPIRHAAYLARSSKPGQSWDDAVSALNTYRSPHRRHPLSGSAGCIPGGFSSPALLEGPGTTCPLQQKWCRNGLTRPPWSFCLLHNTCRGWDR